jgi:hypothetical protein
MQFEISFANQLPKTPRVVINGQASTVINGEHGDRFVIKILHSGDFMQMANNLLCNGLRWRVDPQEKTANSVTYHAQIYRDVLTSTSSRQQTIEAASRNCDLDLWLKSDIFYPYPNEKQIYTQALTDLFAKLIWEEDIEIPEGKIVMVGAYDGIRLGLLEQRFGLHRVVGVDLAAIAGHDNVIVTNTASQLPDMPIAFCYQNVGMWQWLPQANYEYTEWAIRNLVSGGIYMNKTNILAGWDIEKFMLDRGCGLHPAKFYSQGIAYHRGIYINGI